jgi:transcriptional regulator with XRE-family HTH domain
MRVRLRVREIAEQKGYNMSQLARAADIGFTTVKRYFRNPYESANTHTLMRIAEVLGVDVRDLIEVEDGEGTEQ